MSAAARILARYLIGFLIAKGLPIEDMGLASDPEVIALIEWAITGLFAIIIEGWYYLAKRWGWAT